MAAPTAIPGFLTFIRDFMGISATYLPDNATIIPYAFNASMPFVNLGLQSLAYPSGPDSNMYNLAVYNLSGDVLINYATDQPGRTYFEDLRKAFGINKFSAGVVSSTSDVSTSTSLLNPDFMKGLTFGDLQMLKTPYGRAYMAMAQSQGTLWGLS